MATARPSRWRGVRVGALALTVGVLPLAAQVAPAAAESPSPSTGRSGSTAAVSASTGTSTSGSPAGSPRRVSGDDRVSTAIAVARDRFPDQEPAAVLATGRKFADALAGTALADHVSGPLLFNDDQRLDPRVASEFKEHLAPGGTVWLLGDSAALSADVEKDVAALGFTPRRLGGADRYATAAAIARQISHDHSGPCKVILATGTDFADGASAAGFASAGRPLLFTKGAHLPASTAAALARCVDSAVGGGAGEGGEVTAIGGPAADAVKAVKSGIPQQLTVTSIVGTDRYDTSAKLLTHVLDEPADQDAADAPSTDEPADQATTDEATTDEATTDAPSVVLASGQDYVDALVGGTYGSPVLLTRPDSLPPSVADALGQAAGQGAVQDVLVVGGTASVSAAAADEAASQASGNGTTTGTSGSSGDPVPTSGSTDDSTTGSTSDSTKGSTKGSTSTSTPSAPSAPSSASSPAKGSAGVRAGVVNRSGLGWNSGVYIPGSSPAKHQAFATWRGAPVDVSVDWQARKTWSDITDSAWLYKDWAGTAQTKVFGVAMIPEGQGASIAACATGAYDAKWATFGTNIHKAGLDTSTIVRLGWEFNGDWYAWKATNPTQWASCWRHIVTAARTTAPALRWDWNVNRGKGQALADPTKAYPGDAYVDIVGVDSYDMYPGAKTEADWNEQYTGAYGLKFWADFARAHHKALSVPEWGVYPGSDHSGANGGDNPFYITKMAGFFRSQADNLAYEAYFNESRSGYAGALYAPTQAPRASTAYKNLW